jgi:hypothetical protein
MKENLKDHKMQLVGLANSTDNVKKSPRSPVISSKSSSPTGYFSNSTSSSAIRNFPEPLNLNQLFLILNWSN